MAREIGALNVMPLFPRPRLVGAVLSSLWSGQRCLRAGLPGAAVPRLARGARADVYTAVPTMHQAVLARVRAEGAPGGRSRLRLFARRRSPADAGSPRARGSLRVPVIESYGMTEAAHQMTSNPLPPGERKPGSVGPAAGPEVAILAEDGAVLPTGSTGEVAIRGENVFSGYGTAAGRTRPPSRTAGSGQATRPPRRGRLSLPARRTKEIINRGGEKISPREVDEVLLAHPAVAQAVAFPVPDRRLGEEVGAAVVLRPGRSVTEQELQQFAGERVAGFKVPRHLARRRRDPDGADRQAAAYRLAVRLGLGRQSRLRPSPSRAPSSSGSSPGSGGDPGRRARRGRRRLLRALAATRFLAVELIATLRRRYGRPRLPLTTRSSGRRR